MTRFKTRKLLHTLIILSGLLPMAYLSTGAKKVTTRLSAPAYNLKDQQAKFKISPRQKNDFDRVNGKLTFMAYDKRAAADKETFFVDNGSDTELSLLELEISYYSTSNKLIHRRVVEVAQNFPARETRKVDISSWDTQKSFHYINSVPSKKGSTPYTVKFKVLSFIPE